MYGLQSELQVLESVPIYMMRACAKSFVGTNRLRTFALVRGINTVAAVPCVQEHNTFCVRRSETFEHDATHEMYMDQFLKASHIGYALTSSIA